MTRWFSRLLGRDDPPTYIAQMRQLWRVPPDWTLPTSTGKARIVPAKPKQIELVKGKKAS